MNSSLVPASLPLPAMSAGGPGSSVPGQQGFPPTHQFDTTGQVAPPGMKPRVTATLWEDEGSLCFQVEAKGVCVARREDNHFINGTKLLNVAGMTRGRRDGILKSEKTRHVVKIGPMHLKGVWIPFERALDFANKEKITEQLYPLFVHDIGAAQNIPRYPQPVQSGPFPKSEMAPPVRATGDPVQQADVKPTESLLNQPSEQVGQVTGDDEADHDHDNEYTHTSAPYSNRGYGYTASAAPGAMRGDHVSQDMTGSPHQNGSGRATPRTTNTAQTQWTSGYATPGQTKLPSSNLYSVMSDTRSTANGNTGPDGYPAPSAMQAGYPSQYSPANGLQGKRMRELDDDETDYGRPASRDANGNDIDGMKRRKTLTESTMGGAVGGGVPGGLQRSKTTLTPHGRR
ncbi:putative cell pattern formation-associated protein stua protein [Neofusicoccum parvum UCRNP2]|uniref:Putative cell pattern formation-associated protein stua protein n=1 Tax=Botryosphaeria parva (strain UCR-NP2) TaxID=1287680 RepID=R1FY97_BOTPV|nr:putative cell pattern formation-associated protein stua protein [Neofusicoccum parvum UCRNP2]